MARCSGVGPFVLVEGAGNMLDNAKLAGCVALVTGGGGEIGSAICRRFAQEGASVVAADLVRTKAEEVARQITAAGGRAFAVVVDVADPNSAKAAVAQGVAAFGRLTTLVNVAAARPSPPATVDRMELADWNREVGVNLTGAFLMCKFAVPELRRAGGGSIITIASQLGHLEVPERAAYCTTKAALLHFSRNLGYRPCQRPNPCQYDLARVHPHRAIKCHLWWQGACGRESWDRNTC